MPITSRRRLNARRAEYRGFAGTLKKGLSLKGLIRSTPKYFLNSADDVIIKDYKTGVRTKTGLPAITGRAFANVTATHRPPAPHKVIVVGLQKGTPISKQRKVLVSCDCENYKFVWEYANTVNGASRIKHCNGQPAHVTNPGNRPGLCKHLAAIAHDILRKGD